MGNEGIDGDNGLSDRLSCTARRIRSCVPGSSGGKQSGEIGSFRYDPVAVSIQVSVMRDIGEHWDTLGDSQWGKPGPARYCRRCQAALSGDPTIYWCASCRRSFDRNDPSSTLAQRQRSVVSFWSPAFALAALCGALAYVGGMQSGYMFGALAAALPATVGVLLGYATRFRVWLIGLAICMALGIGIGIYMLFTGIGFACGFGVGLMLVLPCAVGMIFGVTLRWLVQRTYWKQRWFFPPLGLLLAMAAG